MISSLKIVGGRRVEDCTGYKVGLVSEALGSGCNGPPGLKPAVVPKGNPDQLTSPDAASPRRGAGHQHPTPSRVVRLL